jgi:hypothetical protein
MCRYRADGFPQRLTAGAAILALVALLTACRRPHAALDDDARAYVRLAVALGERDPDSIDFYAGPEAAVADLRRDPPSLATIRREAQAVSARIAREGLDDSDAARARVLDRDLTALIARVDVLTGARWPYDQESRAFFGVAPGPTNEPELSHLRARVSDIVGGSGRLEDRFATFSERFVVPPDRLEAVMAAALEECRRLTVARVDLPPGEHVALEFVRDKPWSAFSRYLGDARSAIQINTDFRFTVDQVLQTACHEGYPGHHTRNVLMARLREGSRAPERSVQLTFTPEALASEAAAMLAVDAAFSIDERVAFVAGRLMPMAGLDPTGAASHVAVERLVGNLQIVQAAVARRYLDGDLDFPRAVAALQAEALVPRAEPLVKYINEYRSYVTTYTTGRAMLAARLAVCAGGAPTDEIRWRCFKNETSLR